MLTVLMATHNGARTLPKVLNAFCELDSPDGGWNVVIVDNGSTDTTKEIIVSFRSRLPLTYVFEPVLGKSMAQRTGLLNVVGDLVIFTDDDTLPKPDWLVQMRLAADSQPSFSIFGGSIVPHWEIPPEAWILKMPGFTLGITDPAWEEGPTRAARVFGGNMAVRCEVLKAGYQFDTSLGPVGARYRMGEDSDFVQTLSQAGFRAWHCKRAVVAHMIRTHQMKREWVLRKAVAAGRTSYRQDYKDSAVAPKILFGMPRYIVSEILRQVGHWGRAILSQDADKIFSERWRLQYLVGRAIEGRVLQKNDKARVKT